MARDVVAQLPAPMEACFLWWVWSLKLFGVKALGVYDKGKSCCLSCSEYRSSPNPITLTPKPIYALVSLGCCDFLVPNLWVFGWLAS